MNKLALLRLLNEAIVEIKNRPTNGIHEKAIIDLTRAMHIVHVEFED